MFIFFFNKFEAGEISYQKICQTNSLTIQDKGSFLMKLLWDFYHQSFKYFRLSFKSKTSSSRDVPSSGNKQDPHLY